MEGGLSKRLSGLKTASETVAKRLEWKPCLWAQCSRVKSAKGHCPRVRHRRARRSAGYFPGPADETAADQDLHSSSCNPDGAKCGLALPMGAGAGGLRVWPTWERSADLGLGDDSYGTRAGYANGAPCAAFPGGAPSPRANSRPASAGGCE